MLDSPRNLLVRNLLRSAFFLFFRKESLSSDLFSFSLILQFYFIQEYCFLVLDSSNTEFPDILSWILWNHSVLQYFDGRQIPDLGSRRTMMMESLFTVAKIGFVELRSSKKIEFWWQPLNTSNARNFEERQVRVFARRRADSFCYDFKRERVDPKGLGFI